MSKKEICAECLALRKEIQVLRSQLHRTRGSDQVYLFSGCDASYNYGKSMWEAYYGNTYVGEAKNLTTMQKVIQAWRMSEGMNALRGPTLESGRSKVYQYMGFAMQRIDGVVYVDGKPTDDVGLKHCRDRIRKAAVGERKPRFIEPDRIMKVSIAETEQDGVPYIVVTDYNDGRVRKHFSITEHGKYRALRLARRYRRDIIGARLEKKH